MFIESVDRSLFIQYLNHRKERKKAMENTAKETLVFLFLAFFYLIPTCIYIFAVCSTSFALKHASSPSHSPPSLTDSERVKKTVYTDGQAKTILVRSAMLPHDEDEGYAKEHVMKHGSISATPNSTILNANIGAGGKHPPGKPGLRKGIFHDSSSSLGSVLTRGQFTPSLLCFSNLTYTVSTKKGTGLPNASSKVTILNGVSGTMKVRDFYLVLSVFMLMNDVQPGSLCAIMGPSGTFPPSHSSP
jgi:hypothetical protein